MTDDGLWMGLATIMAVVLGPVIAVLITRYLDDLRAGQARKLDIFRSLMRTRRLPLHSDHVGALNLVEVEFIDHPDVVKAWKEYLATLATLGGQLPPIEQKGRHDAAIRKRETLLTKLIDEIAKVLKIKVEQLDILEGNYMPTGWAEEEWEKRLVRLGLINVLHEKASVPVKLHQPRQDQLHQNPYPPPPDTK